MVINAMQDKSITLFKPFDLKKIFPITNQNSLKHLIRRLKKENIIERLARDRYLFNKAKNDISDFEIANFLVTPSYISLETALSYYGIINQFPYQVTSVTLLKHRGINVRGKQFEYFKIKKSYFNNFIKIDNFLIASKQKAVFDYLYFMYKGLRPKHVLSDIDVYLKDKKLKEYIMTNADKKFLSFLKTIC